MWFSFSPASPRGSAQGLQHDRQVILLIILSLGTRECDGFSPRGSVKEEAEYHA